MRDARFIGEGYIAEKKEVLKEKAAVLKAALSFLSPVFPGFALKIILP